MTLIDVALLSSLPLRVSIMLHQPGECISRRLADEVVRVSGVSGVVQIRDGDVDAGALLNGLQQRGT